MSETPFIRCLSPQCQTTAGCVCGANTLTSDSPYRLPPTYVTIALSREGVWINGRPATVDEARHVLEGVERNA